MVQKEKINVKERYSDGEIDLSMSDLDEVPVKEIVALKKTVSLDLSNNRLTSLPSNFTVLTALTKLDLSKNELTQLPDDFGALSKLRYLDLYKNKLQHLPLSFGQLTNLKFLDLKDNPLVPAVAKIAGPCVDTKGCQQCAKDVVAFYKRLQVEVDNEVEIRNKARQKQLEINKQKKQDEKRKIKKDKVKEKKRSIEQVRYSPIMFKPKEPKRNKNTNKKKQHSVLPKLLLYSFILGFGVFWVLVSLRHPIIEPVTTEIHNKFKLLVNKLPESYQSYGELCIHSVGVSTDYTKKIIVNVLEFVNKNEFIQDVIKKSNETYFNMIQTIKGTK